MNQLCAVVMVRSGLLKGRDRPGELVVSEAAPAQPPSREEQRKIAERRLARAEADLARLERRERRGERRASARDRTVDRRLRRMEAARSRPVWLLLATVLALDAVASVLAVINMFWPGLWLGEGVLMPEAGQWEFVAYLFIACAVASMAFAAYSPMAELQRRLRLVMSWYISVAIIVTAFGLLMATLLRPVEDLDVDHGAVVSWLAVLALAGMSIATVLYLLEGAEGSRLGSTRGYHIAMLVLVAISACALIVIAVFIVPAVDRARGGYLATGEWVVGLVNSPMISAGLGLALLGAMGVLFALPALAGAMATEFLLGLREAEGRR